MAAAQDSKRPARPVAPAAQRAWVRRANAMLVEQEIPFVAVPGDERLELRWLVADAVEAVGDQPGTPAWGNWALMWRSGLQTLRDFGTPRRPAPVLLARHADPQETMALAVRVMKHPIAGLSQPKQRELFGPLCAVQKRLAAEDQGLRRAQDDRSRRRALRAAHTARRRSAAPRDVAIPVADQEGEKA